MASDLEVSRNTVSGFFVADLRDLTAGQFTDWAVPGTKYLAVRSGVGTPAAVAAATTEWEAFSRALRFRIRLFQECLIKRKLPAVEVYCLYATFIPQLSETAIKAINTVNFKYLGNTWSQAKISFGNDPVWAQFWPKSFMDEVVFGYESDGL
jgi:hypothetical protein